MPPPAVADTSILAVGLTMMRPVASRILSAGGQQPGARIERHVARDDHHRARTGIQTSVGGSENQGRGTEIEHRSGIDRVRRRDAARVGNRRAAQLRDRGGVHVAPDQDDRERAEDGETRHGQDPPRPSIARQCRVRKLKHDAHRGARLLWHIFTSPRRRIFARSGTTERTMGRPG